MPTRRLALLFVFVLVELFGFSLIVPILPYYAGSLGASPTVIGFLVASNAFAQLIGAPIIGRLSDRWGRRPLLLFSVGSTAVSFVLLGLANTLFLLFVSRFLDGLFGGSIALAQAYITDVTDEENRARGLGIIGAAFGLGFIVGPALGGRLSLMGFEVPAFLAAGLAALNGVGIALWLPESLGPERRHALVGEQTERDVRMIILRSWFGLRGVWEALQRPKVGPLLQLRLFYSLAITLFQTLFPLYAQLRLDLNVAETGSILTYVGVLAALVQGVGIGWLTARFDEARLVYYGIMLMVLTLLGWAFAPSVPFLLAILAPMALSSGTVNTVLSSLLTKAVYDREVGGTLGFSSSLQSLARVISPSVGGCCSRRSARGRRGCWRRRSWPRWYPWPGAICCEAMIRAIAPDGRGHFRRCAVRPLASRDIMWQPDHWRDTRRARVLDGRPWCLRKELGGDASDRTGHTGGVDSIGGDRYRRAHALPVSCGAGYRAPRGSG